MIDYSADRENYQLRTVYGPTGVTFVDERRFDVPQKPTVVALKHGRLTISRPGESDSVPFGFMQNRHVQQMHVLTSGRTCLRVELSDVCVDLFDGLSVAELEWVEHTIGEELEKHRLRKEASLSQATVPDRWLSPDACSAARQDTRYILLVTSLLLSLMALLYSLREISSAYWAVGGPVLGSEILWSFIKWEPAALVLFFLSIHLVACLWQCHGQTGSKSPMVN